MSWKCPQCGVEGLEDALTAHAIESGGCGYVKFPGGVALTGAATGKELVLRLTTTLGRASLQAIDPNEVRFASLEQFSIDKAPDRGGWVIKHLSYAVNPTYLNGAEISPEGAVLRTGDALSIKDKYLRLTVRLLD